MYFAFTLDAYSLRCLQILVIMFNHRGKAFLWEPLSFNLERYWDTMYSFKLFKESFCNFFIIENH